MSVIRRDLVVLIWAMIFGLVGPAAQQAPAPATQTDALAEPQTAITVHITSPLGRTGIVTKVRIVAQVNAPVEAAPIRLWFYVDGALVGTVNEGPPYAVDWIDENPFERREIVVQAQDAAGRTAEDSLSLPPFEVTDQTEVTSVLLEAGVYDKNGGFASQLDPSVFVVRENGVPQPPDQITRQTLPTTIVLLVDSSQSMSRRMDFVRLAAGRLAAALRQRDKIIVAPFNAHVGTVTGPASDAKTISEAINAMHSNGGTAILDSLLESSRLLQGLDGRRTVILITDGYDENSQSDLASVLTAVKAAQVTVYVVGIGGVAGISLKGERMLRALADETGGRVFFPPRESDLPSVSDMVATDASSRYMITYTPLNQKRDGTWREIVVEVPGGYRVRTRDGYFAPKPPPIRPTLEFTVTNSSHQYLDIAVEDLEVFEDGVAQKVDTFQEAVDPVSIVMALDSSGSMVKSADGVRQAARDFVAAVRPEDSLALITFADQPLFAHTLATNRQWTFDAIDQYQAVGGTALYDALYNSLLTLKSVPGRHAVVLLTDGRDENNPGTGPGSEHSFDDVLELMRTVNAAIFPIGLGTRVEREFLERLAKESGGAAYFPSDISSLAEQYRGVVENLRRRYVVSYTSTNSAHDGTWRKVEIRPRTGSLQVVTRGGYFAPRE